MPAANRTLLIGGTILLLGSLVLGIFLPVFENPRMALSAHQVGITGGILIVLMGLAWPHADLREKRARMVERLLLVGPYLIAISCVWGAIFGTSRATPIAGSGYVGERWQEVLVSVGLGIGSIASLIAVYGLLMGFVRRRPDA